MTRNSSPSRTFPAWRPATTERRRGKGAGQEAILLEKLLTTIQKITVMALAAVLVLVVLISTGHLGVLIAQEIWKPPRFLIPVQGLLEIFGYFLLVLIGVELLETLKAYVKRDVIPVSIVLEVALIAMARKVIIENRTVCQA